MTLSARPFAARRWAALRLEPLEDRSVPAYLVGANFSGGSGSTFAPPDTDGAVGPSHFVQFINGRFAVYTKSGSLVGSVRSDRSFWNSALPAGAGVTTLSHPHILYDPLSGRWFASEITTDVAQGNRILVGRSDTGNPAGTWRATSFRPVNPLLFADDNTLAVDANGVYIGMTEAASPGATPINSDVTSIPKVDLLLPTPSVTNRTQTNQVGALMGQILQGVTNFDPNPIHASILSGDLFVTGMLWRTTLTGTAGPGAQFGPTSNIQAMATPAPMLAHQPDGTAQIDPVDSRFGGSVYQVGDLIVGVRTIQVNGWDAVRLTVLSDSQTAVVAEATWTRTGFDYIDPSVAMNAAGDILIGFTRSGSALGTGANDGRLGAYALTAYIDPNNPGAGITFGSEIQLRAGATTKYHQTSGAVEPWGRYSATTSDPANPTSFWTTQEFAVSPTTWRTRVAQIVVSPRVVGVSSTAANGTYGVGAVIPITVTFNAPVVVTGTPQLALAAGPNVTAKYVSGSGTTTLTFNYTVQPADEAGDLDYLSSDALILNGGTIKLKSTQFNLAAILTLSSPGTPGSLGANKDIVIDTRPRVTGGVSSPLPNGTYQTSAVIPITVTFNGPVDVTGTPQLSLNSGTGAVASYAGGTGTTTLTFNYTVLDGQTAADLDYTSTTALTLNGGTIRNHFGGAAAVLTLPAPGATGSLGASKNLVIDTRSPIVVGVTSSPPNWSYGFGQVIPITVTFNKPVDVTGTPELALNSGGSAIYTGGTGTAELDFTYTVGVGDFAAHLDSAFAAALTLNGGTITDQATGVDATRTLPVSPAANSLAGTTNIVVDARPAELLDVRSPAPNGAYRAGTVLALTVTFTKPVDVSGNPVLALNSGGTAVYTGGGGTFTQLAFTYTVGAGENTEDLDAASSAALTLNGGTILDHTYNTPVPLDVPVGATDPHSLAANNNLVIDTTAPSVVEYRVLFGSKWYNLVGASRVDLPWRVTAIQAVFDEPILEGQVASLTGLRADRMTGLKSRTLTWRLASPLVNGSPATALAHTGPNALTDRAGNPINPFGMSFNVLWGDYNGDHTVDINDEIAVRAAQVAPYLPGIVGYNLFADLSGDGIVNLIDVGIVRGRSGNTLP